MLQYSFFEAFSQAIEMLWRSPCMFRCPVCPQMFSGWKQLPPGWWGRSLLLTCSRSQSFGVLTTRPLKSVFNDHSTDRLAGS